ncbi:unnamed protein product [Clonostachys rosea]|uniref:SnoaL-like domain-containing protein n=1 Tax=Bionectria ochroleuca TaxID=29856 RepID=A0ABY6ULQ6_BIOOC|nr:unnamed protein product [Clonostachys rosea]
MSTYLQVSGLSAREACVDAVLRFTQGLDDASEELLDSALTDDFTLDATGVSVIGRPYHTLEGKATALPFFLDHVGAMDTCHMLSCFRVALNGDEAKLTCYSLAQHHRNGEGSNIEKVGCLMGNRLTVDLRKITEGEWKMTRLVLKNAWL